MSLFSIVLNKDSVDGVDSVNECCPFEFGSIMGQEDLYREDPPGTRVDNTLVARIVWATTVPATSRVIWGEIDDVGFPNDTGEVATDTTFHEVFFPVNAVNTTYKFQVISESSECDPGGETLQSGTYYFEVGGDIVLGEYTIVHAITTGILQINVLNVTNEGIEGSYEAAIAETDGTTSILVGMNLEAAIIPTEIQSDLDNSSLYTDYSAST